MSSLRVNTLLTYTPVQIILSIERGFVKWDLKIREATSNGADTAAF
jgi:hypothetical protein